MARRGGDKLGKVGGPFAPGHIRNTARAFGHAKIAKKFGKRVHKSHRSRVA